MIIVKFINGDVVEYPTIVQVEFSNTVFPIYKLIKKDSEWIATLTAANVLSIEQDEIISSPCPATLTQRDKQDWGYEFCSHLTRALRAYPIIPGTQHLVRVANPLPGRFDEPFLKHPEYFTINGRLPTFGEWRQAVINGEFDMKLLGISGIGKVTLQKIKDRLKE